MKEEGGCGRALKPLIVFCLSDVTLSPEHWGSSFCPCLRQADGFNSAIVHVLSGGRGAGHSLQGVGRTGLCFGVQRLHDGACGRRVVSARRVPGSV